MIVISLIYIFIKEIIKFYKELIRFIYCRGYCFMQNGYYTIINLPKVDGYISHDRQQYNYNKIKLCSCKLKKCRCCGSEMPEWILRSNSLCSGCDIRGCSQEEPCFLYYKKE